ncbi:condensin complex subunit 2 [Chelonus insularis]|uniref:condensin complex subunit 2 n=1 Tax=Chelonus insularis TaxID=460826 RepID=UPI00158A4B5D|nr:condensin complex subunit 2 [Chelonus insularis]
MDRRKSLGHVLTENVSSPLRRRSSIGIRQPNIDLNVNDDEAERVRLRLESKEPTPTVQSSNRRHSLNFGVVMNMTTPQIAEGIAECIKLSTQNKINTKNAFSLNMIDFMSWMVKNKQQEMGNLQMAAMGLDISAKIYALRVEGLHQKILNMAGNLDPNDTKPDNTSTEENVLNGEEGSDVLSQQQKKKKKKNVNKEMFTTIEALQGKKDSVSLDPIMFGETDCQVSSMLHQFMLPQHSTQSLFLHVYHDILIDDSIVEKKNKDSEVRITWPPVHPDANKEMNPIFSTFEFLDYSSDQDSNPTHSQERASDNENLAFDLDASLPPDAEHDDGTNYFVMDDDGDERQVACESEPAGPVMVATIENILDKIPAQGLEYSMFDQSLNIRWVGPSHWKIKNLAKNFGSSKIGEAYTQNSKKKKKDFTLQYSIEEIEKLGNKFKKGNSQLRSSTLKYSWLEEKLILQKETSNDKFTDMCKLYYRPDYIIRLLDKTDANATNLDDAAEGYNYNNVNDISNYCPSIHTDDIAANDDQTDDYNPETNSGFVGMNLIEAPKLTQKIFIPYSQRAKKLDMFKLKKCIWKNLETIEQNNDENIDITNQDNPGVKGEKSFAKVFESLPDKLNKNDAEELSFPIAFVSLLHLANEKCLKILGNDNYSDLTIQQDQI